MSDTDPANKGRRDFLIAGAAILGGSATGSLAGQAGLPGRTTLSDDVTAPKLRSRKPAANALEVSRRSTVELTFSEPVRLDPGAVTLTGPRGTVGAVTRVEVVESPQLTGQPTSDAFTAATDATRGKVTLKPKRPLGFGERYTIAATSGVHDLAGNAYAGSTAHFTTIPRNPVMSLGALVSDTYNRRRWTDPALNPWNVLPKLVDYGFEWLRMWVTTQSCPELRATDQWWTIPFENRYWSCLELSGALLREGADLGMRLQVVLFLSHLPAHAGQQYRPPAWVDLSEEEVRTRVESHARRVAQYYKSLGLAIEVFEIGNEIDFGVCGVRLGDTVPVPPGIVWEEDQEWMRDNVWVLGAPILKAAIRGIHAVYPDARILLHIAGFNYSRENIAAVNFFQSMIDLDVPFDIAGLSFPYQEGNAMPQPYFEAPEFLSALDRIATFGRPIQIVEFDYPADPAGASAANIPDPRYPYTPIGQANFIRDLAEAVRGKVEALHFWYPDYYPGFDPTLPEREATGLFGEGAKPRPALSVFNRIAEGRLLP